MPGPAQVRRVVLGTRSAGGGVAPTPPTSAPGYLSSVVAPYAAYGSQRIVSGYSGNVFKLRRTSDNALMDFACISGGDYIDYPAVRTWAGAGAVKVNTLYDQSGNARHITAASPTLEPWLDLDRTIEGRYPIVFDHVQHNMQVGSLALDLINFSVFAVLQKEARGRATGVFDFTNEAGSTPYFGYGAFPSASQGPQSLFPSGQWAPPATNVLGVSNGSTAADIYAATNTAKAGTVLRSNRTYGTPLTTQALARFRLGIDSLPGPSADGGDALMWLSAFVIYPATVSTTDGPTVWNSLRTAFNVMPNTAYAYVASMLGDSIVDGSTTTLLRNMPQQLREKLTKNALIYNKGFPGEAMGSAYSARVSRYAGTTNLHSGITNVDFIQYGTNDLFGVLGPQTASGLYSTATTFVTYLKGLGVKVPLCTLLPRTDTNWTGAMETERIAYNALVRTNSAGADYVLDLASHPVMGSLTAPNDTTLYTDKIHPTNLGQTYLAGAASGTYANQHTYYYALQEVMRTALVDPTYVI